MKKTLFTIFTVSMFFIPFATSAAVQTTGNDPEKINLYRVEMKLTKDGTANVAERIVYDFGRNQKHGIFRNIPMLYKTRRGNPHQNIKVTSVVNENNVAYKTKISGFNTLTLQIGDEDVLVSSVKTYIINYQVKRVINSLTSEDQFIWNFIGDGWDVPIEQAEATVVFPTSLKTQVLKSDCYIGAFGSKDKCSGSSFDNNGHKISQVSYVQNKLNPREAMTTQIDFPSGTFRGPSKLELFIWESSWYLVLPVISFIVFFGLWFWRGRDAGGSKTVIAQYDAPKEIEPAESGYLIGESMNNKQLSAQLIYLATKGYLRIKAIEKKGFLGKKVDYELEKIKDPGSELAGYDTQIISALFKTGNIIKISDLKENFAVDYQKIKRDVYKTVLGKGYYRISPVLTRTLYIVLASVVTAVCVIIGVYLMAGALGWISFILSGVFAFFFAIFMPAKTIQGTEMKRYLIGLKEYIRVAEADRIKFHNAPKKNPAKFEELLPYAMIFGLEKEWAAQFADIYKTPPDWYSGNYAAFSVVALSHDLNSFTANTSSTFTSVSSSGAGGGFSGGGGGGGGGGSW